MLGEFLFVVSRSSNVRLIEISDSPRQRRAEAYLRDLAPPVFKTKDATVGSIAFGSFPTLSDAIAESVGWGHRGRARPMVLREISHPRHVRDIIAGAQT